MAHDILVTNWEWPKSDDSERLVTLEFDVLKKKLLGGYKVVARNWALLFRLNKIHDPKEMVFGLDEGNGVTECENNALIIAVLKAAGIAMKERGDQINSQSMHSLAYEVFKARVG